MDDMGAPDPPCPPRSVGDVLGTGRLPDDLVGELLDRFSVTREKGGPLSAELRSGQGLHSFLGHIASGVYPSPGLEYLALLGDDRDRTVHILHLFFSFPVTPYATTIMISAFSGELPM